jgi:hypothetical protein
MEFRREGGEVGKDKTTHAMAKFLRLLIHDHINKSKRMSAKVIRTLSTPNPLLTPHTTLTAPALTNNVASPKALKVYKAGLNVSSGAAVFWLWFRVGVGRGGGGMECRGEEEEDRRGSAAEVWRRALARALRRRTMGRTSATEVTASYNEIIIQDKMSLG